MPSLAETQRIFWHLITAPDGARQGLDTLPGRDRLLPGGAADLVRGDERLGALERIDVYANMYFFRLLDVLKEDFPAVLAVLGAEDFHDLVTAYLIEHPSTHPSVRFVGRHLARFLEGHAASRRRPWIADLARLEWAIVDAFDGPDAEALPAVRLQALPPERWAGARFRLAPTLETLDLSAPVHVVWGRVNEGEPPGEIDSAPTTLRVWREGLRVLHRAVDPPERAALRAVVAGEDFAAACEAVAEAVPADAAPAAAAGILRRWFADGLVVGLDA